MTFLYVLYVSCVCTVVVTAGCVEGNHRYTEMMKLGITALFMPACETDLYISVYHFRCVI
jgi:hypothetical protein